MILPAIPNIQWLAPGIALTIFAATRMEHSIWFDVYLALGVLVSCTFLIFHNPKPDLNQRFDIAICVPILALMWPVILLTLILEKPWNSARWKNRLQTESDQASIKTEVNSK